MAWKMRLRTGFEGFHQGQFQLSMELLDRTEGGLATEKRLSSLTPPPSPPPTSSVMPFEPSLRPDSTMVSSMESLKVSSCASRASGMVSSSPSPGFPFSTRPGRAFVPLPARSSVTVKLAGGESARLSLIVSDSKAGCPPWGGECLVNASRVNSIDVFVWAPLDAAMPP